MRGGSLLEKGRSSGWVLRVWQTAILFDVAGKDNREPRTLERAFRGKAKLHRTFWRVAAGLPHRNPES